MARIDVIPNESATGDLRRIYDDIINKRGKLANVHMIQSLRPESIVKHMELYMEIMFSRSELTRAEREMIAVVVSVSNGCTYCQNHHGEALNHYWKDSKKLRLLIQNPAESFLTPREVALCNFARHLTVNPQEHENTDFTKELRKQNITDSGILDTTLVIAYFNFVNRIVLALNVEIEADAGKNYKY